MADNPNMVGADRRTISNQPHEIRHVVEVLAREFPQRRRDEIFDAVNLARQQAQPSESRELVIGYARERLR